MSLIFTVLFVEPLTRSYFKIRQMKKIRTCRRCREEHGHFYERRWWQSSILILCRRKTVTSRKNSQTCWWHILVIVKNKKSMFFDRFELTMLGPSSQITCNCHQTHLVNKQSETDLCTKFVTKIRNKNGKF